MRVKRTVKIFHFVRVCSSCKVFRLVTLLPCSLLAVDLK